MAENEYKYFAFISYNSKDQNWGKKLQRKLEHFRMPSTLCSERNWKRTPMNPVFFAPTDIQPGGLDDELKERLKASQFLIVICSPNSAKSEWVGKEIEYFHALGRTDKIQFFIVDGEPHSGNPETECFNPVTKTLGLPEILGANIHEKIYKLPWLNRERAYVQLVSKLLGVEFDSIWNRHRRQLIRKLITWVLGVLFIAGIILWIVFATRPVDVKVNLKETTEINTNLPPLKDAVVTLQLANESKTDTLKSSDNSLIFTNIPADYIGKEVNISFSANDFNPVNANVVLTKDINIEIARDPSVYGDVKFKLWNPDTEKGVAGAKVEIAGQSAVSNQDGEVTMTIPLDKQNTSYTVTSSVPLLDDTLHMPCSESTVMLVGN